MIGTPEYMQAGESSDDANTRTDIYSVPVEVRHRAAVGKSGEKLVEVVWAENAVGGEVGQAPEFAPGRLWQKPEFQSEKLDFVKSTDKTIYNSSYPI